MSQREFDISFSFFWVCLGKMSQMSSTGMQRDALKQPDCESQSLFLWRVIAA